MPASSLTHAPPADRTVLRPPLWVDRLLTGAERRTERLSRTGPPLRIVENDHWALLSARVAHADALDPDAFERATAGAYLALGEVLARRPRFQPARVWNLIPHIHRPCGGGLDRYMVFNAGRHAAYCGTAVPGCGPLGARAQPEPRRAGMPRALPTATGVGHRGDDLVIHLLATDHASHPVENPRQRTAHRYSARYGPKPPCFARATTVAAGPDAPRRVLVGGTASILGEESMHADHPELQTEETFRNLAALLHAADDRVAGAEPKACPSEDRGVDQHLSRFTELRVYYPRSRDRAALEALVRPRFPRVRRIEWRRADLCRRDLLVEIEGVAFDPGPQGRSTATSDRGFTGTSHERTG